MLGARKVIVRVCNEEGEEKLLNWWLEVTFNGLFEQYLLGFHSTSAIVVGNIGA